MQARYAKLWMRSRRYFYLFGMTCLLIPFQNCSPGFKVPKLQQSSLSSVVDQPTADMAIFGQKVYVEKCSGCHGSFLATSIHTRTFDGIKTALKTQPFMAGIASSVTDDEVRAVVAALNGNRAPQVCATAPSVGAAMIQRLNSAEYDNTLRDLLGITAKISEVMSFSPDAVAADFANNAQYLLLTADMGEKLYYGAEMAVTEAFKSATIKSRLMACDVNQNQCVNDTIRNFLSNAFRRPPTSQEVTRYAQFVTDARTKGATAEHGMRVAFTAVLASPHFLFRIPQHPDPQNPSVTVNLTAYELAAKLSYFIWSSMPDATLTASASSGRLLQLTELEAQVRRMLKDPKAAALVSQFGARWMHLHKLNEAVPDPALYPEFSEQLRSDLRQESLAFLKELFDKDASFFDLLKAKHTFVNGRLARHYGIAGVPLDAPFTRVNIDGSGRQGILTHGSLMAIGSSASNGSIVKRGNFILESILCSPPPPPPVDTPEITAEDLEGKTPRQALVQHRSNPSCYGCHAQIDPLGFGFEHFDPLGRYITQDRQGRPVDASGAMPDGRTFNGAEMLTSLIQEDQRFQLCAAEKLFTFAVGRSVDNNDRCTVNRIGLDAINPNVPLSTAILSIVMSDPFRKHRGWKEN